MLKLVIADDEAFIRECLSVYIPWSSYGIEVVGTARDGLEALEQVRERQPDLLIADIKMPLLDGMSLLERVRAEKRELEIIIISGFQEFEYARKALKYGCMGYVLKPIEPEELIACVMQAAEQVKRRKESQKLITQAARPEAFIRNLLHGEAVNLELDLGVWYADLSSKIPQIGIVLLSSLPGNTGTYRKKLMDDMEQYFRNKEGGLLLIERGFNSLTILLFTQSTEQLEILRGELIRHLEILNHTQKEFHISFRAAESCSLETLSECYWNLAGGEGVLEKETETGEKEENRELAQRAKDYVEDHYSSSDLSLNQIAAELGISPSYLSALFSAKFGCNLIAFINQIRLKHAKEFLTSRDSKIEVIAEMVGYESGAWFSTLFKRETGKTPSEYRRSARR